MDKTTQVEFSPKKKPTSISEALQQRMDELKLGTISQVAAKMDLSLGSVSPVFHGKKTPTSASLQIYANFLGIPLSKAKELSLLPAAATNAAQTEVGRAYEQALAQVILAHGVTRLGLDTNAHRQKDPLQALAEARMAFEADIAAKATKGISPRLLLLLRRLPPAKHARLEQLLTAILEGDAITIASRKNRAPANRTTKIQKASRNKNRASANRTTKIQKASAEQRNRRLSRSQRLTTIVNPSHHS
jgi:transcriptional regulator with XRE-family HTH domain